MTKSRVRLFFILAIVAVASSSMVFNLASFSSRSNDNQDLHHCNSSANEHPTRCLRECVGSNIDDGDSDRYLDTNTNVTAVADNDSPREWSCSCSHMVLLSILWFICFTNFEWHQLILVMSVLFIMGRSNDDIGVVIGFFVGGFLHFLATKNRSIHDPYFDPLYDIDDVIYYDDESAVSFRVSLGQFTWVISGSRNHC
mmetsp:Transcript_14311/g.30575  ORF Transcript_14311/g.30575 Transcript_14311/m.30575 type:complete len:198 (+) Transcript_14311:838-1431(+)